MAGYKDRFHQIREVRFVDGPTLDAFGRLRSSEPQTLFESQLEYSAAPLFWESVLTATGTATHVPNEAAVKLEVAASGDKVIRQTHRYIRYQPGKSQEILMTFVMGTATANVTRQVGYYDAKNGLFLKQTATGLSFVRRTFVSGSAVDNAVTQSSWNLDSMDGTGASGITLDVSKSQILFIDIEWLGVGRVRMGFVIDGNVYYAHQFLNTNVLSTVYMTTANLPLRYEIEATGEIAAAKSMYQICASVNSEGGRQEQNIPFNYVMTASRSVTNTAIPLLSIQVDDTFPASVAGIVNRETVIPLSVDIYTEDAAIAWWLIYNGTLTDPVWVAVNTTHSGVNYDISATAITGGLRIGGGYAVSTNQSRQTLSELIQSDLALSLNVAGTAGDTLSVVAVRLTGTSSDTWAGLTWKELY